MDYKWVKLCAGIYQLFDGSKSVGYSAVRNVHGSRWGVLRNGSRIGTYQSLTEAKAAVAEILAKRQPIGSFLGGLIP